MRDAVTSLDIPQPVWVYGGYVTRYGAVAVSVVQQINRGMSRRALYAWTGSGVPGFVHLRNDRHQRGAYEHRGPYVLRIFEYPLIIGVLEAAQVICFGVAAAHLRRRAVGAAPFLGLCVVFPFTGLVAFGSVVNIVFALALVWRAVRLLPGAPPVSAGASHSDRQVDRPFVHVEAWRRPVEPPAVTTLRGYESRLYESRRLPRCCSPGTSGRRAVGTAAGTTRPGRRAELACPARLATTVPPQRVGHFLPGDVAAVVATGIGS